MKVQEVILEGVCRFYVFIFWCTSNGKCSCCLLAHLHRLLPAWKMSSEGRKSLLVDNWQSGKTITECNLRMLNTGDFSDVTFRVGSDKQVVGAHRYILVSRCCVFHAMFSGPLAAEKGEITIPDIEPNVFREFLR